MRSNGNTKRKRLTLVESRPAPASEGFDVRTPAGYRAGDKTLAMRAEDDAMAYAGLYKGDMAVIYGTSDVTPDDLAALMVAGETWLGTFRPAPGGYFTF